MATRGHGMDASTSGLTDESEMSPTSDKAGAKAVARGRPQLRTTACTWDTGRRNGIADRNL